MIQCGDVEQNPGPVLKYAERVKTVGASFKNNVKIFSLNCRSIVGQNSTLKQLMDDLGKNTIFGFTETWLKMNGDIRFWGKYAVKIFNVSEKIGIFHYMTKQVEVVCCSIYLDHLNLKNVQISPPSRNPVSKASG